MTPGTGRYTAYFQSGNGHHARPWLLLRTEGAQETDWPQGTLIPISTKEPRVTLGMAGKKINFLVDTGASYSVLNSDFGPLSLKSAKIMGIEGNF